MEWILDHNSLQYECETNRITKKGFCFGRVLMHIYSPKRYKIYALKEKSKFDTWFASIRWPDRSCFENEQSEIR